MYKPERGVTGLFYSIPNAVAKNDDSLSTAYADFLLFIACADVGKNGSKRQKDKVMLILTLLQHWECCSETARSAETARPQTGDGGAHLTERQMGVVSSSRAGARAFWGGM